MDLDAGLAVWAPLARVKPDGRRLSDWPTSRVLFEDYCRLCEERGWLPPTIRMWGLTMGQRFRAERVTGARGTIYVGVDVRHGKE
jgi:hypothetical protein